VANFELLPNISSLHVHLIVVVVPGVVLVMHVTSVCCSLLTKTSTVLQCHSFGAFNGKGNMGCLGDDLSCILCIKNIVRHANKAGALKY